MKLIASLCDLITEEGEKSLHYTAISSTDSNVTALDHRLFSQFDMYRSPQLSKAQVYVHQIKLQFLDRLDVCLKFQEILQSYKNQR